ncbi:MAG: restriction endonuclease subunit S [Lactococcus lactis]|nr:restriction endonuclease subunit S [Lactococcus lactis]
MKFSDVVYLRHGHQFRKYDFVKNGIPVIKIGQCKANGNLDLSKCNYVESSRIDEFDDYRIEKGDILMALTGGTLGKVTEVDKDYGVVLQNYRVGNFFPKKGITREFIKLILLSNIFQDLVASKVNQGAQPNIGKDSIDNMMIPLPPLPEQERIVTKLDAVFAKVDQAIGLLEENIATTQALMGSVLDEEFGRLENKGIELKAIKEFAKTKSGGTPRRSEKQFWNGNIPWLKSGELNDSFNITENTEFITEIGLQKSSASLFKKGTLLMAMYGATAGRLGILGMDACTNQAVCSIQNHKNLFDEIYIYFFFLSQRERIIRESFGGAQPNISKGYIDKLEIPLPDLETQKLLSKKFFDYQNGINSIVATQTQKLSHLKALKSSLLDQAFKGEL